MFIFQFLNDKIYIYLKKHNCEVHHSKIEKKNSLPQKVYKLSKAKFSHFDRTRGDKKQIFRTYGIFGSNIRCHYYNFWSTLHSFSLVTEKPVGLQTIPYYKKQDQLHWSCFQYRSLLSLRFNYKPGYEPCDLLWIQVLSLVKIFSPVWILKFQPMRGIKFTTGHMAYNLAYD